MRQLGVCDEGLTRKLVSRIRQGPRREEKKKGPAGLSIVGISTLVPVLQLRQLLTSLSSQL